MKKTLLAALLGASFLVAGTAMAAPGDNGTASTSFNVSATVGQACTVHSDGDMDFGSLQLLSSDAGFTGATAHTTLTVLCNDTNMAVEVGLAPQSNTGGGDGTGTLSSDGTTQDGPKYALFQDSALSVPFGQGSADGYSDGETITSTDTTAGDTVDVYASIAPQDNIAPGTYTDTVNVKIAF